MCIYVNVSLSFYFFHSNWLCVFQKYNNFINLLLSLPIFITSLINQFSNCQVESKVFIDYCDTLFIIYLFIKSKKNYYLLSHFSTIFLCILLPECLFIFLLILFIYSL